MIRTSFLFVATIAICSLTTSSNVSSKGLGATSWADPFTSPEIHPKAWETPINQISQVACHNCYEQEIFDSPLPEALNYIKAIELDIWDQAIFFLSSGVPNDWFVRHNPYSYTGTNGNHNNCSGDQFLSDCLSDIRLWSNSNPGHFPITLFLDKKQDWSTYDEGRTPKDLFNLLKRILGSKLYLPRELAKLNSLNITTPARWKWPTADELRGRIIVVINGGNFIRSSNRFPFNSGNETYNATINQIRTFDKDSTAFAGPYVFQHDDFIRLPIGNPESQALFLNSNYSSTVPTLMINYFNKGKVHNRLLRLWKVDDIPFCNLLKLRVAYQAYYEFLHQDCHGFRIVPMGREPDELQQLN